MITRLLRPAVAGCLLVATSAGVAMAHADLIASDPADGSVLTSTPALLTATFNEELDPDASSIVVRNSAGDEVASGSVNETDASVLVVELPDLEPDDYTVRWTAVTPDDQGITRGTITFTIASGTPPPTGSPTVAPTASTSPGPSPPPIDDEPTGGTDVLLALALAGAAIGGLAIYLIRRR